MIEFADSNRMYEKVCKMYDVIKRQKKKDELDVFNTFSFSSS